MGYYSSSAFFQNDNLGAEGNRSTAPLRAEAPTGEENSSSTREWFILVDNFTKEDPSGS